MKTKIGPRAKLFCFVVTALFVLCVCPSGLHAQTQYLTVDCTGATPGAFTSISSALSSATSGTFILITGPCTENVSISAQTNLSLGAYYGQSAALNGNLSISNSTNIYVYGLNVSNPSGDGIDVNDSRAVSLDTCSSNGSAGIGLSANGMSDVNVNTTGTFDSNVRGGISVGGNSIVSLNGWGGPIDISSNTGPGIYASQGNVSTLGQTNLVNNSYGPGSNSGYGVDLRGGAHFQFGAYYGPNLISGNQSGGVWLQETAELSFWCYGQTTVIQNNGPVGVSAGLGSQLTLAAIPTGSGTPNDCAQITGHTSAGVDLYGNSQLYVLGPNLIHGNGSATDPRSAGIRLDGNSEALLRAGEITNNFGPGMLALVNSSADFSGVTFSGNAQGLIISCDTSSYMVSDLVRPNTNPPQSMLCRVPHILGNHPMPKLWQTQPDATAQKTLHNRYIKYAVKH